ncbi:metallophosphoesterase [Chitinophaga sp. 22321]|uniref:Metallophosphoesterase n=1 Tax=Chitinophaga hostae TaxID=2831022 RepID=A0ABS5IXP4_9BACT|nr:metallophosphoesterase [Chitinophaga hostae]MBS0027714.1 metallophosphoesterase [Chitinophaga hostae]
MRILHIGDFHYRSNKNEYEQKNIVKKLISHLSSRSPVNLILFSGDLVFSGKKKEDFEGAHDLLIKPLIEELHVSKEHVFICSGNHDINRDDCSRVIIDYFSDQGSKIRSNEELNSWISGNPRDFDLSLQSGKNYYEYAALNFSDKSEIFNEFFTIHKVSMEGKKVAIVTINSSWLCSGFHEDNGNLLFPTDKLKQAINKIDDSDCKILMLHHPLNYFREYNYHELQDLIHRSFNLMLAGHVHKEHIETQFNSHNGIYCNTTHATLCFDGGDIGYSILDIDLNAMELITLERGYYIAKENSFVSLDNVVVHIPCGEEKFKQNKLRNKIIGKYDSELEISNQLLLNYDGDNKRGFIETFTDPVLSSRSDAETENGSIAHNFDYKKILAFDANYLIFGKDKCGKTSLLKYLQLSLLKDYSFKGIIPFYIDYKQFDSVDPSRFDLAKEFGRYYNLNNADSNELINNSKILFLIDNLSPNSNIHLAILSFLGANSNVKFVACSEYMASRVFIEELDSLDYNRIFFKNLSRKEIRLFTRKQSLVDDNNELLEKITNICTQLQLPLNYWTVSLILLIYKKNQDDYNKNLFSVLDACVDEILNKKRFIFEKSDLKFEQYKAICSQISYFLFVNYKDNDYGASYMEVINFIDESIKKNPRIVTDAKSILDYLINVGILRVKGSYYTFRLNGIFEYFLAYYLRDHPSFRKEIVDNDSMYLSFKNELELYSGFNRNDVDFLINVYNKTKKVFDPVIEKFKATGSVDDNLLLQISNANDFAKNIKELLVNAPIKDDLQDEIYDTLRPLEANSEVHVKEVIDVSYINFELLEKYISILARVFKNLDSIENTALINEVFKYILDCYCYLGFYFIDEYGTRAKQENLNQDGANQDFIVGEEILQLMARMIPVLMQSLLYDGVGHLNLKKIVENKIIELEQNPKGEQYKLFMLYFLYVDLDINSHKSQIDRVFENITIAPLKIATLFKLNFYLAFKAFKKPELEQFFKLKIQAAQLRIDNKTDVNDLQKLLSNKQRKNLIKRSTS